MTKKMKTTMLLGIMALSAVMIIVLLPAALAAGTECKAIGGKCEKSCSSTTQVDNGKMDCGTAGWFWKVQTMCCTKKPCSDGTLQGSCSTDRPKYCNTAAKLVDLPSRCPCPDGLVKKYGKCVSPTPAPVKKTQCDDGTKTGKCSATKPKWCNSAGKLIDNPKTCGCPDGQVYNKYSAKCVTGTPTTPIPSSYCTFMPTGVACGSAGGTCKGGKCVTPTPTATPTKTPTPAGTATPTKTPTPTPVPVATASCSDTDTTSTGTSAVFNYGVKGTCTDTGSAKICPYGCSDACASGNENKVGGQLNEYYCYAKRCYIKTYSCPSGQMCSSGRCIASTAPTSTPTAVPTKTPTPAPTATPSCSDTDTTSTGTSAVFNYGVKGTCTDTGSSAVCASGCADVCQSSSEGVVGGALNEYYCYAKRCYMKNYSCPATQKCSSGACVPA